MFCDNRTHALARHSLNLRRVPSENPCFQFRKEVGGSSYPGHRTCTFKTENRHEPYSTFSQNIRVIAQYYTRITLPRLTSLLDLTAKQTEQILARLVVSGTIWAKIDRPAGIVNFRSNRGAEEIMNDWSSDMQKLLGLVEKTWMGMNAAQAAQSRVTS